MSLTFHTDPFPIPDEYKISLWRFNDGDASPYVEPRSGAKYIWDLSAKAVSDSGDRGVYGVWEQQMYFHGSMYVAQGFDNCVNLLFMKLEADRRDIVMVNDNEISVSKCNIVEHVSAVDFVRKFTMYQDLFYWCGVVNKQKIPNDFSYQKQLASERLYQNHLSKRAISIFGDDDAVHGYAHSLRVERNMMILCKHLNYGWGWGMGLFAYYHDILRLNDGADPDHGKRAAELLRRVKTVANLGHVPTDVMDKICYACENHTAMQRSGDPLIDICFDADRLDLMRVGIKPDPRMMATNIGAHYAENYEAYVADFQNMNI